MANFFSLYDGNLTDVSVYGYSLTGAEVMNNTIGIRLSTGDAYGPLFVGDGSTISAVAVHLSSRQAGNTTDSLILKLSAAGKSVQTEYYPISNFTTYDGSSNLLASYPLNWQILKLSTGYQISNLSSAKISFSTTTNNTISLMGSATNNNFDKAVISDNISKAPTSYLLSSVNGPMTLSSASPFGVGIDASMILSGTGADGSISNYILLSSANPTDFATTNFTMEGWFNFKTNTQGRKPIISYNDDTVDFRGFTFSSEKDDNLIHLYLSTTGSSWDYSINTGIQPAINTWHHIAIVRYNGTISVYYNGSSVGTPITIGNTAIFTNANTKLKYGYYAPAINRTFDGYISNIRVSKTALYTSNFTRPSEPFNNHPFDLVYKSPYTSPYYAPIIKPDNIHIGGSVKLSATEVRSITADTYTLPNIYVHNQGILTFPTTASKTLTLNGSAGLQITSDGIVNIGTSSQNIPLSTTHTVILSNTQIDVHNGGNFNVYGYQKLFNTNLVNDTVSGSRTFTTTDTVSSIWNVGDILTFKPSLSYRTGFDTLTLSSFTGDNTFTTTSASVFTHTGSATYANIAGLYNLNRNVKIQGLGSTARGSIRTVDASKTSINYASLSNFGLSGNGSIIINNNLSGSTTLSGIVVNNDSNPNILNITTASGYSNSFNKTVLQTVLQYPDSTALSLAGTPFTIECWVNPIGNYTDYNNIISKRSGTPNFYEAGLQKTTGCIGFYSGTEYYSAYTLTPNIWSHCAWVHNGTNVSIYVNGISVYTTPNFTITNSAVPLNIGGTSGTSELFYGKLYGLRIIKGLALYTSNFTPTLSSTLSNYTVTNSFSTVFLSLTSTLNTNNSISAFKDFIYNVTPTSIGSTLPTPSLGTPFNTVNNLSVYSCIFNKSVLPFNLSYPNVNIGSVTLNNVNVSNNYILSSVGTGLQITNSNGSINMSNNTTIGSLSYGTYLYNNTLTGTYGADNYNSALQGMMISGTNTGTIVGGGLNSAREGVYVDASTYNLSGATFQNILANNNSSVGFKVSGNNLNYLTPVTLNINGLVANTNSDAGIESYNIVGNISGVIANNNYVNGIKISIGNGSTIFDGLTSITSSKGVLSSTKSLNILSGYNYNQIIIKNSLLSATSTDPTLSAAVGLSLDSTRFSQFSLENSTISAATPLQLNTTKNLLEGSYLLNNSYLGSTPFGATSISNVYQPDALRAVGFAFTNYNNIVGYNVTYLAAGSRMADYTTAAIVNTDKPTERLSPTSITTKLRSGSKYLTIRSGDTFNVGVYIKKSTVASDGVAYNGNPPRLICKRNPAIGITNDVVISQLDSTNDIADSYVFLMGNIPYSITDDGIAEFYVDCDGTAGFINTDNWYIG